MYFLFTALVINILCATSSLISMERIEADFELVDVDQDASANNEQNFTFSALIAKASPVIQNAAEFATRKINAAGRKLGITPYHTQEDNPKIYSAFIDMMQQEDATFDEKAQHQAKKCLNRYWHCSKALFEGFKNRDLEAVEANMNLNKLVLHTDLNQQILSSLKKAVAQKEALPAGHAPVETATFMNSVSNMVSSCDILNPDEIKQFKYITQDIANLRWTGLVQSPTHMKALSDALRFQYSVAEQLALQSRWIEANKDKARSVAINDIATQIVLVHKEAGYSNLPPVFETLAEWTVQEEKNMLERKMVSVKEAEKLFSK